MSGLLVVAVFLILFLAVAYGLFTRKGSGIDDHSSPGDDSTGADPPPTTADPDSLGEDDVESSASAFDTRGTK